MNAWRLVNEWGFRLAIGVIAVSGFYATIRLIATEGLTYWLGNIGLMIVTSLVVSSVVVGVRALRRRYDRWWLPLVLGAVLPVLFFGYVMLSTPPFAVWTYIYACALLASTVCWMMAAWAKNWKSSRG